MGWKCNWQECVSQPLLWSRVVCGTPCFMKSGKLHSTLCFFICGNDWCFFLCASNLPGCQVLFLRQPSISRLSLLQMSFLLLFTLRYELLPF